jgi:hypothetical protein
MPEIEVEELRRRPENDVEHEVAFRWGGRRLKARVLLMDEADASRWAAGTRHAVELRLVRAGKAVKMAGGMRPGLDDEGEAIWRAIGPVVSVEDDIATMDVGFPLAVDLDPIAGRDDLVPALAPGDSLAVRGELRVDEAD